MSEPLEVLAKRAEGEPFFLGHALAALAAGEKLDDPGLAARLGCPVENLTMLRLCRAPDPGMPEFWDDVTQIAERFGIDPRRLAEAVKRGRVILRLRVAEGAGGGFLMAARDQDGEPPDNQPPGQP
jgi:hypothetical protein